MAGKLARITRGISVDTLSGRGLPGLTVSARLVVPAPAAIADTPRVLFCMPGGGMTCNYFDLDADGDRSFSFAEAMARRGHIVVLIDYLGIGESSRPDDGFLLHPRTLAAASAEAIKKLGELLHAGGIADLPALGKFLAIGVGHSMGGMLTGLIQARFALYDGVVMLGAGPFGLYAHLDEVLKPLADDTERVNRELVDILRDKGVEPYWTVPPSTDSKQMFRGGDRRGAGTLRAVRSHLLTVAGQFSMIPGSWAPEAAGIEVPVLLAFGDEDLCESPHTVPAYFTSSPHVSLAVLPETGHTHFIFPSREILWRRVDDWLTTVPG